MTKSPTWNLITFAILLSETPMNKMTIRLRQFDNLIELQSVKITNFLANSDENVLQQ